MIAVTELEKLRTKKMNIIQHDFPSTQYMREEIEKRQLVLHHTVSGDGTNGDINWWMSTPERVATAFLIDREGKIHQMFDEEYWAYHLGMQQKHFTAAHLSYQPLDKTSIGIELDSWGPLLPAPDGKFYPVKWNGRQYIPNTACKPVKYFTEYCQQNRFRGFIYYEKYTTLQLSALKELLITLCSKYKISKQYTNEIWAISGKALRGESGIFAHCSYRPDKSDVHPQPELVTILKTL